MTFTLAGYFPKRIVTDTAVLDAPRVREVWSVSNHVSQGPPEGWIDRWVHNALWLFDTPELARSILPASEADAYTVVAYRIWSQEFVGGESREISFPELAVAPCESFESLGFDAASHSPDATSFECSPLSCNYGARTLATNELCLFPSLEQALTGAREFSRGGWEPGIYRVVEVLRKASLPASA